MRPETLFLLLILLACPIGMMFMMRGGGHGSHGSHGMHGMRGMHDDQADSSTQPRVDHMASIDELRSQRAALDAEIERREAVEETGRELPARGSRASGPRVRRPR